MKKTSSADWLVDFAGFLFLAALLYAPAAMGSTPPWALRGLSLLLGAAIAAWLVACLMRRSFPAVPRLCLICLGCILLQGWGAIALTLLTASSAPHGGSPAWWLGPRVADVPAAAELTGRLSLLAACLPLVFELAGSGRWRRRLWWTIALTGAALCLLGLLQKMGVTDIASRWMNPYEGRPFATFNYHGTAGEFINAVVPFVAGLIALSVRLPRPKDRFSVLLPGVLLLVCLAGAFVNVSRAAQAVLLMLLLALAVGLQKLGPTPTGQTSPLFQKRRGALWAAGVLALFLLVGGLLYQSESAKRWSAIPAMVDSDRNARAILSRVTLPMAREAGVWGSGAGSYKILFPRSPHMVPELYPNFIVTTYVPGRRISMWSYAHNDYVQTIIEWGWLGSLVWGVLLGGGLARIGSLLLPRRFRRVSAWSGWGAGDQADPGLFLFCADVALLGMAVHALVDFPFQIASLQLYATTLLGICWRGGPEASAPRAASHYRRT